ARVKRVWAILHFFTQFGFIVFTYLLETFLNNHLMLTITIDEIQKNFTSYLHQVAAGESIIIMESGKAI
ncbi:hypothetical protein QHH11_24220, partial [Aphanizomenon sp. PH219]|nr:hypothetical protein [Aphanizomenon sp. PH219]